MINDVNLDKFSKLYQDFLHPNPNINSQAMFLLIKDFSDEFIDTLINNLKADDLIIRRKSILALSEYGEDILKHIVELYLNNQSKVVKVSCLKIIVRIVAKLNLKKINKGLMSVIDSALSESSPEITLTVISILRQFGLNGRNILMKTCRDDDLLKAKASVSALLEMKDQTVDNLLNELLNDQSTDSMIKEDILRDRHKNFFNL